MAQRDVRFELSIETDGVAQELQIDVFPVVFEAVLMEKQPLMCQSTTTMMMRWMWFFFLLFVRSKAC